MLFGWAIFAAALVVFGTVPPANAILAPVFLLLLIAVVLGIGLMTSALNVRFRDIGYLVPFAVSTVLFVTPVVYPASLVPDGLQAVYALNPMVGIIGGLRWCLLDVPLDLATAVISSICALALLVGGLFLFSRGQNTFADYI
jgi:lipopolysaccharide transport system permease protein